ncbi:TetR/AcrR family transcriptional regulator [Floricoccus penangensis]|uniref:TetR/AcrR family transcriptional regulator n=1 Tax=Floricoccus penangensis TaxID=1859475 RepID=UPI00203DAB02|nr:TetR/AcrR family transcriptional regulator [Floricoccus penangensis]URZ87117.1 TetR/AcrR family transcriptional regulator [Floricoccus penangensis]
MVIHRKTSSKKDIKKAFAKLLNEKGLEKITVSDITRRADVNRGTFYSHYTDKYELLNEIEDEILSNLKGYFDESVPKIIKPVNDEKEDVQLFSNDSILHAATYAKDNFEMIHGLISEGGNSKLIPKFKKIMVDVLQERAKKIGVLNFNKFKMPDGYAYEIMLSSVVSILEYWILNDTKESPEEIVKIINTAACVAPTEFLM